MADYGLDIAIPYTGDPDPTLPWADDDDALLVPGSVALMEMAHTANPVTGVPAANAFVPNIAWKRLKDILGSGDATTLGLKRTGADIAGALITERSSKGGLHLIASQTNNNQAGQAIYFGGDTAVVNYMVANAAHAFYMSLWERVTRVALGDTPPQAVIGYSGGTATTYGTYFQSITEARPGTAPAGMASPIISYPAINALGNRFRARAFQTPTPSTAQWNVMLAGMGLAPPNVFSTSAYYNQSASRIVYRVYIEDLTVSGRTYAQVQALDFALWQEAMGTGGRYAGDTFTAPAI